MMKNFKSKIKTTWKRFVYWLRKNKNTPDYVLVFQRSIWDRLPAGTKSNLPGHWDIMYIHKGDVYVFGDSMEQPRYLQLVVQYCETAICTLTKDVLKSKTFWARKRFYDAVCEEMCIELLAVGEGYRNNLSEA